ncbi:RDD family protein [Xanthomonas arboricola]|uniref:RDD family protein n=1 Tax=Xanthomonas arboricola TaxID=56448 RepID=UPI0019310985|nr:RDD family protein [Xanthomonas arboricola]
MSDKFIHGSADLAISWILPAALCIWLWVTTSQTPGKMAIGALVVDARLGKTITVGKAVVRYLTHFLSMTGLCIGYLWVGFDSKKQGWRDHIAGTVVITKSMTASHR